jgi:carbon storage regulator
MLVFSRRVGESFMIGRDVCVKIVRRKGHRIIVGIDAPKSVGVHRLEVYKRIDANTLELKRTVEDSESPTRRKPRISPALEIAVEDQRGAIETAISLAYVLHTTLRQQRDGSLTCESAAVSSASKSANLTDISAMLLVRLDLIHIALDPMELVSAEVDHEAVRLREMARKLVGTGDRHNSFTGSPRKDES